jgi:Tfp pilus assembly protein PilF
LQKLGRFDEALKDYDKALSLKSDHWEAFNNRGNVLQGLGRFDDAIADYSKAISLKPDYVDALSNRGAALKELQQFDEAMVDCNRALSLKPDYVEALNNRGNLLQELRYFDEAMSDYNKAISLKPDYAEAHWNKSLQLLKQGEFPLGWELYEWRWKKTSAPLLVRKFTQPLWLGKENLCNKTILLHCEQGLGDTIQFSRYAAEVSKLGCRTILEVQEPLFELMKGIEGADELIVNGADLPSFDFYCPLMSLPLAMGTTLETIPSGKPYLRSNDDKLAKWSSRLGQKSKPRVGIVWSGNTKHTNDHNRSIALEKILSAVPEDYELVSLQKEVRDADRNALEQSEELRHFGAELGDFTDTAALCELMDIVVSVDTSVAHLAGALGKPVNLLLPYNSDFRWLLDRHDSPWYPSMKLFIQGPDMLWEPVFEKVNIDLGRCA